jgi:hypothetical protein
MWTRWCWLRRNNSTDPSTDSNTTLTSHVTRVQTHTNLNPTWVEVLTLAWSPSPVASASPTGTAALKKKQRFCGHGPRLPNLVPTVFEVIDPQEHTERVNTEDCGRADKDAPMVHSKK